VSEQKVKELEQQIQAVQGEIKKEVWFDSYHSDGFRSNDNLDDARRQSLIRIKNRISLQRKRREV